MFFLFNKRMLWIVLITISFNAFCFDSTDSRLFSPFSIAPKQRAPEFTKMKEGSCDRHSEKNAQTFAYHCQSKNALLPTCFAPKYGEKDILLCVDSPWSKEATALKLTTPLPEIEQTFLDMSKANPWAIELENHVRCQQSKNALDKDYICDDGSKLTPPLYRCKPIWTISQTNVFTNEQYHSKIRRAWF